jgi:hypothetical protein
LLPLLHFLPIENHLAPRSCVGGGCTARLTPSLLDSGIPELGTYRIRVSVEVWPGLDEPDRLSYSALPESRVGS